MITHRPWLLVNVELSDLSQLMTSWADGTFIIAMQISKSQSTSIFGRRRVAKYFYKQAPTTTNVKWITFRVSITNNIATTFFFVLCWLIFFFVSVNYSSNILSSVCCLNRIAMLIDDDSCTVHFGFLFSFSLPLSYSLTPACLWNNEVHPEKLLH